MVRRIREDEQFANSGVSAKGRARYRLYVLLPFLFTVKVEISNFGLTLLFTFRIVIQYWLLFSVEPAVFIWNS